ncbi:MAG: DUF4349 domain-containing protein [Oscillospiraceae bacterium]|nr:DUF4349 domain-containing protein [Oscillospiraceae bacterium]
MNKKLIAILSLLLIAAMLCACSAAKTEAAYDSSYYADSDAGANVNTAAESVQDLAPQNAASAGGTADAAKQAAYGQKIVYTTNMSIETKEFEDSYNAILAAVKEAGGYVASKSVSGGYTSQNGYYNSRSASLTLKIPADKYQDFLSKGPDFGNVTQQDDTSEDITSSYIDTQARLDSLEAQKTQLLELLDKAQSVDDIILIRDKLTDVIYQIESYTATLKTYDDLVSYCTVYINLSEVTTITVHTTTFGEELVEALKGSGRSIVNFLRGAVIAIIYAIPYLVVFFLVFLLARKIIRTAKAKKAARAAAGASAGPAVPPAQDADVPAKTSPFAKHGKD